MFGPYALPINQNDENFRKQLNALLADIDARIAAAAAGSGSAAEGDVISDAYTALSLAASTSLFDGVGSRDQYADATGIDQPNSSGLVIAAGDVTNATGAAGTIPNNMTSNTAPSPRVASASAEVGGAAYKAFDGSTSTGFGTGASQAAGDYLRLDFGSGVAHAVNKIIYDLTGVSTANAPASWSLQGSSNGTSWTNIFTNTSAMVAGPNTYSFSNSVAYRYVQIIVNTPSADTSKSFYITELTLSYSDVTPAAAVLRRAPLTFAAARKRAYAFHLVDLASGVALNTDLSGALGDGTTFTSGAYKALTTLGGHQFIGLYDSGGALGIDLSALNTTSVVSRDTMTAKGRIDFRASRIRGA